MYGIRSDLCSGMNVKKLQSKGIIEPKPRIQRGHLQKKEKCNRNEQNTLVIVFDFSNNEGFAGSELH